MTRIYTRTGDGGETSLFGGGRVSKDDLRVRAYGTVDELNAAIGLARAAGASREIDIVLERLQHQLFDLGAELATPDPTSPAAAHALRVTPERITALEQDIDRFEARLPPLRSLCCPEECPRRPRCTTPAPSPAGPSERSWRWRPEIHSIPNC